MQKKNSSRGKGFLFQLMICTLISFIFFAILHWLFKVSIKNALFFSAVIVYFFIGASYFSAKVNPPTSCSQYYGMKESNKAFIKSTFKTNFPFKELLIYSIPPTAMLVILFVF